MSETTTEKIYTEFNYDFFDKFQDKDVSFTFRFAKPIRSQIDRAQKGLTKRKTDQAMRQLCLDVIHEEDKQSFKDSIEEYPGLAGTFGEAILLSCGFGQLGN